VRCSAGVGTETAPDGHAEAVATPVLRVTGVDTDSHLHLTDLSPNPRRQGFVGFVRPRRGHRKPTRTKRRHHHGVLEDGARMLHDGCGDEVVVPTERNGDLFGMRCAEPGRAIRNTAVGTLGLALTPERRRRGDSPGSVGLPWRAGDDRARCPSGRTGTTSGSRRNQVTGANWDIHVVPGGCPRCGV